MFKGAYAGGLDASDTPLDLAFADENDVVITFTDQWTGLRGMVRGPDGTADPAATVVLYPMNTQAWEGPGYTPRRFRTSLGQPDGSFNLTSIPPGDYYVVAIPEVDAAGWNDPDSLLGLMRDATRVTVQEGEQRTLDLRTGTVR
jgi:hypothetical protein